MIALSDVLLNHSQCNFPVCRDGALTFDRNAFLERVAVLAAGLRDTTPQRYALCLDDPFDFACALFALFACGKQPVLPASASPAYLAVLQESLGAFEAVITDASLPLLCPNAGRDALPIEVRSFGAIDARAQLTLYTSGSSGTPKPVSKTLAQLDAEVRMLEAQWGGLMGDAVVLGCVPHHHIYGLLFRLLWPLAAGRPFDRALCVEPQQVGARLADCGAGVVVATPAQLARWPLASGFAAWPHAPRAFFSSGGPLAADTAQIYHARFKAAPFEIFGSTETGGIAWRRQDLAQAWQLLPGVSAEQGEHGALRVRSPHLAHESWHGTDDAVTFDDDGRFHLTGRLDRVIKLEGKRVSLPELEGRLTLHPYVAHAAIAPLAPVTSRASSERLESVTRQRVGAIVVLSAEGNAALLADGRVALSRILRRHLAGYFDHVVLPRHWRFLLALPLDARGKLPASLVAGAFVTRADGIDLLSVCRSAHTLRLELRVPADLVHFAGHFPELPILPGVVQLDWMMRLASEYFDEVHQLAAIERLKFMAPVFPGARLTLQLEHDPLRQQVSFVYQAGHGSQARDCASGVVLYRSRV
ncbi:AMP-binding protein [Paraburkholderia bonniea]|uniref:AMP-binding protein n=1 Tax=Paraburkholderia bonniea TaxID=2152891 RepID=UPI0025722140|nr:AMP-binding protein [Paraburkholderia bonniea]WJF91333.1 AMP-binding protein [Paraburkholderia bonniea]WJF94648.1 AMP-binding protein [Paraburkholderia bonniea]